MRRALLFVVSMVALACDERTPEPTPAAVASGCSEPSPALAPERVIQLQLDALADADAGGIERAYRFASPDNRAVTGPLPRFERMLRSAAYRPLLGKRRIRTGQLVVSDRRAEQLVVVERDGELVPYHWVLVRSDQPPCVGCWLTESVIRVGEAGFVEPEAEGVLL